MSQRKTKRFEFPQKSVLSEESQLLLEEIFAFFYNRELAKKDPDMCLEAMLTEIHEDLLRSPITATLQLTLSKGCRQNAAKRIRKEKKAGEFSTLKTRGSLQKEVRIG